MMTKFKIKLHNTILELVAMIFGIIATYATLWLMFFNSASWVAWGLLAISVAWLILFVIANKERFLKF